MKFTKIRAGWYATPDGKYAVIRDGNAGCSAAITEATFGVEADDGWVATYDRWGGLRDDHNAGINIDWYDTKREAVAACERLGVAFAARVRVTV